MSMLCDMIAVPDDKIDVYWNLSENPDFDKLDLDRVWHALSFLLSDSRNNPINAEQLTDVVLGKHCFNPEEKGDYPTTYNDSISVRELSEQLNKVAIEKILEQVDFDYFAESDIYCFLDKITNDEEKNDCKNWLLQSFYQLKAFYNKASQNNHAIVVYIG